MIHELSVPIPVLTPKGRGFAYFLIDYSMDNHLMWVCFIDETGECWTFSNPEIRIQNNPTVGRVVLNDEPLSKTSQEQSQPLQKLPQLVTETLEEWQSNLIKDILMRSK